MRPLPTLRPLTDPTRNPHYQVPRVLFKFRLLACCQLHQLTPSFEIEDKTNPKSYTAPDTTANMSVPEGLPKMEYRFLGRSGLQVSAISLGGWLTFGGHVENGT
jgi:hypothetical protein